MSISSHRLETFMHALTGEFDLKIGLEETLPYFTDRLLKLDYDYLEDHHARAVVAHNAFHIMFTDPAATSTLDDRNLQVYAMMLEDVRVDALGLRIFPGLQSVFLDLHEDISSELCYVRKSVNLGYTNAALQEASWKYLHFGTADSFEDEDVHALFEIIKSELDKVQQCQSTMDCLNLGKSICSLISRSNLVTKKKGTRFENPKGIFFPPPSAYNPSSQPDDDGDPDEGDSEPKSKDSSNETHEVEVEMGSGSASDKYDPNESISEDQDLNVKKPSDSKVLDDEFGRIHKNVSLHHETKFKPSRDKYQLIQKELYPETRSFVRRLQNMIKHNEDERRTGLVSGAITQSQMWRKDGKVFQYKKDRNEEADLAITILVDESGSMDSDSRDDYARHAAVMLAEVCESLHIPLSIVGHHASFEEVSVTLSHYISFGQSIKEHKANLVNIRAKEDNRDGLAIRLCGEELLRQPNRDKLLIVISDGEPCHRHGYMGPDANDDTKHQVRTLENKGVTCVGVSIGEGSYELERFYQSFVSVSKLSQLPQKLVRILEKHMFAS